LAFAFIITFVFILMVLISSVAVSAVWPGDTSEWYVGSTLGRLVSIFILLMLLFRLSWLGPAGFTRPGRWSVWLVLLLPLAYSIAVSTYAMTGNFDFSYSDPALAGFAALFLMAHAFLEEVAFRGLILYGFVRRWGSTNRGLIQSVLVSSLFFGAYHILYLAGEPLPVVLLRIVFSFLLGILLGTLVLIGKSIYPAAFFHGILNLAAYLNLTGNAIEGTPSSWLWMSLLILPLAGFGIYLLRDVRYRRVLPESA
jgi:membrane protease YdiL (CAAX protease family)